jgi:hypothetical protein
MSTDHLISSHHRELIELVSCRYSRMMGEGLVVGFEPPGINLDHRALAEPV